MLSRIQAIHNSVNIHTVSEIKELFHAHDGCTDRQNHAHFYLKVLQMLNIHAHAGCTGFRIHAPGCTLNFEH